MFDPLAASSSLSLSVPSLLTYSRQFTLFLTLYSLATLRQSTSIPLATRRNNVTSTPFSYPAPRKYKPDNPGIFTLPTSSHYRHPLDIIDSHTPSDSQHSTRFDPAWPSVRFVNIASFINLFSIIDYTSAHSVGKDSARKLPSIYLVHNKPNNPNAFQLSTGSIQRIDITPIFIS